MHYLIDGLMITSRDSEDLMLSFEDFSLSDLRVLNESDLVRVRELGDKTYSVSVLKTGFDAVDSNFALGGDASAARAAAEIPPVIVESLANFRKIYPDESKCAFIMMKFEETPLHEAIETAICDTLMKFGFYGLRADRRQFHDELFPNVLTYIHGCRFGIAVLERLVANDFNPNVSLEVGYMFTKKKSVCLFKDKTLPFLQTDLVGKLYEPFDTQRPAETIPKPLTQWLNDKDLLL